MGDKRVAVGVVRGGGRRGGDEVGEGMNCMDHPYRSNAGGVCAFCLQEKLSKLVSSSNSSPFFPFQPPPCSSSSSPTSFRSDADNGGGGLGVALASDHSRTSANGGGRRTMFPFLADTHSKKKKNSGGRQVMAAVATTTSVSAANDNDVVLRRTKSVAPRKTGGLAQGGGVGNIGVADSPRKKSFWSFVYISSTSSTSTSSSSVANNNSSSSSSIMRRRSTSSSSGGGNRNIAKQQQRQQTCTPYKLVDKQAAMAGPRQGENGEKEAESPSGSQASSSFGRKVARSRSVGCGSRSFSGDFLDRISTGFGDCALRRVESHREPKSKIVLHLDHDNGDGQQQRPRIKERVNCGGLFRGLGMMSSASWLSSAAAADDDFDSSSRTSATTPAASASTAVRGRSSLHGRTRSWGRALASPVRAFRPYFSSKSLYAISNTASASPVTNPSDKMVNIKASRLDGNASFLAVEI
ncbi:hypothetical protein BHE74_00016638 [Ensete ventricosum]|nr:hypothetical protein GW17_00031661 [Ensete ventricosum]RWW75353.1 hypothetical protein BHE74_00016638 [Ensete ventricosum]RZR96364.1 hypothetical protein BHM03_00025370 [Ensete ventricosum]